ncbi:MAG: spore germination protein [Clostridia bacterium]|nr:spore germination protein [Clostridia bacterium]
MTPVSRHLDDNRRHLEEVLGADRCFDVMTRSFEVGGRACFLVAIDGLVNDSLLLRVLRVLMATRRQELVSDPLDRLVARRIPNAEVEVVGDLEQLVEGVLSGQVGLAVDGVEQAVLIDLRTYPARQPQEPDLERVLRGPKDGFVETLVMNTALIRRRLRDPNLRFEAIRVGSRSHTDVVLAYVQDVAPPQLVAAVRERLRRTDVEALPMAEKAVEEIISGPRRWWNPLPTVRYSERPDVVAVHLLEGHVAILVDTSPVAMCLPATFFHHVQHAEEFHQNVIPGVFFRLVRYMALLLAWFGTPAWVAFALDRAALPPWLDFIGARKVGPIPLFGQFILAEVGIEMIRMALIHTPGSLATALGVIGAVLLGELAVQVGLFTNEVVLYVTLSALGAFALPSAELANAVRVMRIALLVLAGLWRGPGLLLGVLLVLLLVVSTDSFGVPYLWPLLPFRPADLVQVLVRRPAPAFKHRPSYLRPGGPLGGRRSGRR